MPEQTDAPAATAGAPYDYSADRPPTSEADLQAISKLARDLVAAEADYRAKAEEADRAAALVKQLAEVDLPGAMERAGQRSGLTTVDGLRVDVKQVVRANVPAATKDRTYDWLDEHGHGAIVKRTIEVPFGRDAEDRADQVLEDLRDEWPDARLAKKVESSTLSAWVRQQREAAGELPPPELLTVHDMPVASVKAVR